MEDDLVHLVKAQLAFRRLRYTHFDSVLFDEHAWDMLMILFVARAEHREIEDIELITETAARLPTGLRWLSMLEHDKKVVRTIAGERILVTLTEDAAAAMQQFFQDAVVIK